MCPRLVANRLCNPLNSPLTPIDRFTLRNLIIAPISEEWVFRGLIVTSALVNGATEMQAIGLSTVCFALGTSNPLELPAPNFRCTLMTKLMYITCSLEIGRAYVRINIGALQP